MQPSPWQRSPFTKPVNSAVRPVLAGHSMKRSFQANEMFFLPRYASSAAQLASDLAGKRAVRTFHTIGNTDTLDHFFSPGDRLPQISDIFADGALLRLLCLLSPQCLLNLSAGSRALHCHATCDDVYRVVICGSLLADSFCVLTHKRLIT